MEGVAHAAELKHSRRAREIVRLRTKTALRERYGRDDGDMAVTRETGHIPGSMAGEGEQEEVVVGCNGCTALYEANEVLLREARTRGLVA